VSVFLKDDATTSEVEGLSAQLAALPHVLSLDYLSKADAFEEFKKTYEDQPEFWVDLSPDALPASLRVTVDTRFLRDVARSIPRSRAVDDVRYGHAPCAQAQIEGLRRTIERLRARLQRLAR
jgi:cell division protein FtsX